MQVPIKPETINDLDLSKDFNIGLACTRPAIPGFDMSSAALIVDQGDESDEAHQAYSYRQLDETSNQCAALLSELGLAKGDRVMLWLPNVIEFPIAFYGTVKLGSIAVPSSILLSGDEIDYLAKDSGARVLITTAALAEKLHLDRLEDSKLAHVLVIDDLPSAASTSTTIKFQNFTGLLASSPNDEIASNTCYNDPAYLVYTSGTTGYPKGVLHAHRALLGRLPAAYHWFDYQEGKTDRILHSGKFNWTYVLGTAMMDPMLLGKTVVVYNGDATADTWPKLIAKHQCTIFIGVPTIYRQIIQKTKFSAEDVPTLRHCMCAGEHLSDEMLGLWQERFSLDIFEAIGMSECSYYLSHHPTRPIRPGSAGCPQTGHKIHLLDENLEPVKDGEEGMLCIDEQDLGLFIEYWQLPDTTQATRKGGYFLTGDYAKRDEEGYVWFLGRRDDIINSFGFRISPHEIERVLKTHPEVADCVALEEEIEPDKNLVVASVIRHENSRLDETSLLAFAKEHLAQYKVPKKIYFTQLFPRTANGKVLRKQMKADLKN